jgi:hypothetical protein
MNYNEINKYFLIDDLSTYDPYDIWKMSIGIKVKQLYYKNKYLGLLPAGILTIYDIYINNSLRLGYKKQEYPITRAQAALALINLYKKDPKALYLEYAKKHIDWLLANSSKGYSGHCWGLNFVWVYSATDTYGKNTPFSTHTPYPLEAMVLYYNMTKDNSLLEPIKSLFAFLEQDIKIMQEDEEQLIVSYGVEKDRIVTNANSYVMYMYALLLDFLPEKREYIEKRIRKLYHFLVSVQLADGSWIYSPFDDNSFIDCFHSAFVLKNIIKTSCILTLENSEEIVSKGYRYILDNFLDQEKMLFRRFSQSNKISLVKFDLYDNAEMLNLAFLMHDQEMLGKLEKSIRDNFIQQNKVGSTIDIFGFLKNIDHLRWAVVPYLYALSNLKG